jgi:hypothetical protein
MGFGAAVVRADWATLHSLWEAEASGEMDVVVGASSSCGGLWRRDMKC